MDRNVTPGWRLWSAAVLWFAFGSTIFGSQFGSGPWSPSVTVAWNASPDPTVTGYYVYYGTNSGVYPNKVDVGTNTMLFTNGLRAGLTYYLSCTSYNSARVESVLAPEVSYVVPGILTLAPRSTDGSMRIKFPVAPEHYYELQSSPDLKSWRDIWVTSIQTSNAWLEYDQVLKNMNPRQFYRLILH